jgi:hypothetical protein
MEDRYVVVQCKEVIRRISGARRAGLASDESESPSLSLSLVSPVYYASLSLLHMRSTQVKRERERERGSHSRQRPIQLVLPPGLCNLASASSAAAAAGGSPLGGEHRMSAIVEEGVGHEGAGQMQEGKRCVVHR